MRPGVRVPTPGGVGRIDSIHARIWASRVVTHTRGLSLRLKSERNHCCIPTSRSFRGFLPRCGECEKKQNYSAPEPFRAVYTHARSRYGRAVVRRARRVNFRVAASFPPLTETSPPRSSRVIRIGIKRLYARTDLETAKPLDRSFALLCV